VDTLYLSLDGMASECTLAAELRARWAATRPHELGAIETPRWTLSQGRLEGHTAYEYMAKGKGDQAGVIVLWGQNPAMGDHPTARRFKVLIGSKVLWRHRAYGGSAASAAREVLAWIVDDLWTQLPASNLIRVRRVDVCLDHWGYDWTQRDLERFACRQNRRGIEKRPRPEPTDEELTPDQLRAYHGATSATYYVGGHGSACRYLRVYNKIAEAMASGKLPWMEPLWRQHGWDGIAIVWRAEIEHGGDWLKAHGLATLDQLDGCEHALWLEYLGDVRHTTARASRLKRSNTSPVWKQLGRAVATAAKADGPATWTWLPRAPTPGGDMKVLGQIAAGCARKMIDTMFPGEDGAKKFAEFLQVEIERSRIRGQLRDQRRALNALTPGRDRRQPTSRARQPVGAST